MADPAYADFVLEQLEPLGGVSARRMFGGVGLFRDGLMFGIIAADTLYLKVDDGNRADYEAANAGPFLYTREGREVALSYYEAPAELFDDPDELSDWARRAFEAAIRAKK